ncbi:cytochrome c553 [Kitasatospora sp. GAS204A]|uniref:hypothetical protein n=1 Tax=unclassified Kitasatospora TaxID=2633591 RepID=UPI00247E2A3B|nr:cytochrome c553 [Kitasatospora sp. GAS204B]
MAEAGGDVAVPVPAERVDRQVAQGCHVLGAAAGADLRGVLAEGGIANEVKPVLDGPLSRVQRERCRSRGLVCVDVGVLTLASGRCVHGEDRLTGRSWELSGSAALAAGGRLRSVTMRTAAGWRGGCGMSELERITARRSELDALAEELGKQLREVQAERDELVIAERVLRRLAEQDRAEAEAAVAEAPVKAQVAGRAALLVPHRGECPDESALPGDYRRILSIVRAAGGAVQVRAVGEELGLEVEVRGKLEPLRARLTKLAERGWLHKRPDGKFAARL